MSDLKPAPHGWIVLDKPRGLGSTQAVAAVKRNLREGGYAKTKVGHGGTLDPLAEGVLPIALGEATKLAGRMLDASKIYEFTIQFGEETSTLDTEGEVVARSDIIPEPMEVYRTAISKFRGKIDQLPPAYSAIKVDGKRAYDRARAGEKVDLKKRTVTVHAWNVLGQPAEDSVTLIAHVSKGTYIRSLARDIARALGTYGHVTYLRRTKAGPFHQNQAISLDKLNEIGSGAPLKDLLLPLEAGLDDIPALILDQTSAQAVRQGRVLSELPQPSGLYCGMLDNVPVALLQIADGTAKVVRGFNLPDVAE
ncbi:tRNA pseudouridine(55) synthase TruB [Erythrobacter sp. F6033]|uniref:tRNA pseudouridine(55) synthase TruB n=1 Tax=Erythrobacter sp. F6033 TaxID=2926401 RepID=UPI001FF422DF|nr:tRNA pseudouridine(55) synthase TruB [Erythrobacter sp. F6033]MCK0127757.1 tRNA pseudouridine(55) synthase TruB [Erythrobacter sp. F6033]